MNSVNLIYEPDSIGKNVCWLPFSCAKFRTETFCIFLEALVYKVSEDI